MATREIASIVIYPTRDTVSSPAEQLSALAEYSHSLLGNLPENHRQRHRILTSVKSANGANYDDRGIDVVETWTKGSIRYAFQILRHLAANPSLRVVHLQHEFNQFGKSACIALIPVFLFIARFLMRRKIVVTFHEVLGPAILQPDLLKRLCIPVPAALARFLMFWYYRIVCLSANIVFVQHEDFRDVLTKAYRIRGDVRILPIGVTQSPPRVDREAARRALGVDGGQRLLLFFGTIDWRKGLDVLVDAFAKLPKDRYRLVMAGGQPVRIKNTPDYQDWYGNLIARVDATPGIVRKGFLSDAEIAALFSAADMVMLPYVVPQRVSAVLNQAASYELPFVCSTAFEGHADPLAICEPTPAALAEKIEWGFAEGFEQLRAYSSAYKTKNSWASSAATLASAYEELLAST